MVSATRRASYTSSSEQQRPCTDSGMPSWPARRRWFHSCMVRPTTLWPSARSMAATVEESTPPDMATAMVLVWDIKAAFSSWLLALAKSQWLTANSFLFIVYGRELSQSGHGLRNQAQGKLDVL